MIEIRDMAAWRSISQNRYPVLPEWVACLLTSTWLVAVDNQSFWRTFALAQDGFRYAVVAAMAGLAVFFVFFFAALLRLAITRRFGQILLCSLLIGSAGVSHSLDAWGVLFDKGMVRSILETDKLEIRELMSFPAFIDVVWRGLLPAALLCFLGIRKSGWRWRASQTVVFSIISILIAGVLLATSYGILATTFRNHRELRFQLVPVNYVNAIYGHLKGIAPSPPSSSVAASNANRLQEKSERPLVLVVIVGETARAASFSLGGYERDTNAALSATDIVYFKNVVSCGTDTATSLPCMFSDLGADAFSVKRALGRQNALDVLQQVGILVEWIDNNSGCKGVCARVLTHQMQRAEHSDLCSNDTCLDEVLVRSLESRLDEVTQDTLLVLHQMGSHGPAYFKRYPAPGRFQPTCETNRIQSCHPQALINTYDNTIDYTSQNIAQVINLLHGRALAMDAAVLYISDHGESLGERNIYLHGLPRMLAPSEQTSVPMIAWLSAQAQDRLRLPLRCLATAAEGEYSHDNLFSTLLGFFSINTTSYRRSLDLIATARESAGCASVPLRPVSTRPSRLPVLQGRP